MERVSLLKNDEVSLLARIFGQWFGDTKNVLRFKLFQNVQYFN